MVNIDERRVPILRGLIQVIRRAEGRSAPEGRDLDNELVAWEYAIGDVPTRHLEECFKRAIRAKRDSYPLSAVGVNTQWEELKQELVTRRDYDLLQLPPGPPPGLMTITEFKARHNLPVQWELGDPYPPESDLYKAPLPVNPEDTRLYRCYKCKDSGWLREPYNHVTHKVELVPCGCK